MDWANVIVRFSLYLDLMLVFGLPLFALYSLNSLERESITAKRFVAKSKVLAIIAIVLSIVGFIVSTKTMSGAESYFDIAPDAFSMALFEMSFGTALLIRLAALALFVALGTSILTKRPSYQLVLMTVFGGVALATLAWGGHGVMNEDVKGFVHLGADIVHLIAAGAWIGALASFLLLLSWTPKGGGAEVEQLGRMLNGFAIMGSVIVFALLVTGTINYLMISGLNFGSIFATTYGILLTIKLVFFLAMLALAAANRYRLTPKLEASIASDNHGPAIAALRDSLVLESGCALLILVLIACLGMLNPL